MCSPPTTSFLLLSPHGHSCTLGMSGQQSLAHHFNLFCLFKLSEHVHTGQHFHKMLNESICGKQIYRFNFTTRIFEIVTNPSYKTLTNTFILHWITYTLILKPPSNHIKIFPKQKKKYTSVKVPNNLSSLICTHMHARNIYHPGNSVHIPIPFHSYQTSLTFGSDLNLPTHLFYLKKSSFFREGDDNVSAKADSLCTWRGEVPA